MPKSFLTLPVGYSRVDNEPLMADAVFDTYEEALAFAQSDPTAYLGQIISAGVDGNYQAYIISESGVLTPIGNGSASIDPSDETPLMDGEGSAGSDSKYSRGDHRHPSDTTKVDITDYEEKIAELEKEIEEKGPGIDPYESIPEMDGEGSAGSIEEYAKGDHQHPSDSSKADVEDLNIIQNTVSELETTIEEIEEDVSEVQKDITDIEEKINNLSIKKTIAGDSSIDITETEEEYQVAVNIDTNSVNIIDLGSNGLFASVKVISTSSSSSDVSKSYKIVGIDVEGNEIDLGGETIDILKDQFLKSVEVGIIPDGQPNAGDTALIFTFVLSDGTESISYLDINTDIWSAETGDGLIYDDTVKKVEVKIDSSSETDSEGNSYLTVSSAGIKFEGLNKAIESIQNNIPEAGDSNPLMDGDVSIGTSDKFSREDHRHPIDTSRASVEDVNNIQNVVSELEAKIDEIIVPEGATETPLMDGEGSVGESSKYAREDHQHPSDSSKTDVETFNNYKDEVETTVGDIEKNISELTSTVSQNTTNIEELKDEVEGLNIPKASDETPLMDGEANAGISNDYSREDHIHPSDINKVDTETFESEIERIEKEIEGLTGGATPSYDMPLMDGEGAVGDSLEYARGDHQHPSDTSKADVEVVNNLSETVSNLSNDISSITETIDILETETDEIKKNVETLDTQVTELDEKIDRITVPEASDEIPLMDGEGNAGESSKYSRADHVHPSDNSKASQDDLDSLTETVETVQKNIDELKEEIAEIDIKEITNSDGSIDVDSEESKYDISVNINNDSKNIICTSTDGLFASIKVISVESPSSDVSKSYKIVGISNSGEEIELDGETIDVLKDQFLKNVEVGIIPDGQPNAGDTALIFTFILSDGSESVSYLDINTNIWEAETGDGLTYNDEVKKVEVKIDSNTETNKDGDPYLTVSENGIKFAGINDAILAVSTEVKIDESSEHLTVTSELSDNGNTTYVIGEYNIASNSDLKELESKVEVIEERLTWKEYE